MRNFRDKNTHKIPQWLKPKFDRLLSEMVEMYRSFKVSDLDRYQDFEPLAAGFLDDLLRSSVLLPFRGNSLLVRLQKTVPEIP